MKFKVLCLRLLITILRLLMDIKGAITGSNYGWIQEDKLLQDAREMIREIEDEVLNP